MKKKFKSHLIALLLCLITAGNPVYAGTGYQTNPFVEAMRMMVQWFLMMSQGSSTSPDIYNQPWSPNITPFNTPDNPWLEGTWLSNNRFVLVIQNGYARIAIDQNDFQDYYVRYRPGALQLLDGLTGKVISFRLIQKNNRMALQDKQGRVMMFKKIQ